MGKATEMNNNGMTKTLATHLPQEVLLSDIESSLVQPPSRTSEKALNSLQLELCASGILTFPVVAKIPGFKKYVAIDGHRRLAVLKALGHEKAYVVLFEADSRAEAEAMFARMNAVHVRIYGRDHFFAWSHACDRDMQLASMPRSIAAHIKTLVKILGVTEAVDLGKQRVDPSNAQKAYVAFNFINTKCKTPPPPMKVIVRWIYKHKAALDVFVAAQSGQGKIAQRLRRAILADEKLPYSSLVIAGRA